ncbi:MAG TPA: DUF6691 family protein [Nevskiaceae bacterium]|nr:DUF6691 family protein [Nevskiaceae bacterium]
MSLPWALLSGLLFGLGLTIAGMTDPARVLGFLDLAGAWDPSLAFVMGAALLVTVPAFAWARRRHSSWSGAALQWPSARQLDRPLILGAALFGTGWGLAGLCPGPALANLVSGQLPVIGFVLAMVAGMGLREWTARR